MDRVDTARRDIAKAPLAADASPSVWTIVLTHGGAEEITAACIESLLRQDYPSHTILLVDNASFDGSGARLRDRFRGLRYLNTGGNFGYTGGNNRGMAYALAEGADYVMVLNNDTVVEPTCVSRLVASARDVDRLGAISPKILYWDAPERIWFAGGDFSMLRAIGTHRRELEPDDPTEAPRLDRITFATGCCFLMPASVAREMSGFREDFFIYCEDVELSLRLQRAGYHLYYQPAARVLHREKPASGLTSAFAAEHRDRNRRRMVRQHYTLLQRIAFACWFYPTRAVRLLQYLLKGDGKGARAILAGAVRP